MMILFELAQWEDEELENGSRIKASKINKVFERVQKLRMINRNNSNILFEPSYIMMPRCNPPKPKDVNSSK